MDKLQNNYRILYQISEKKASFEFFMVDFNFHAFVNLTIFQNNNQFLLPYIKKTTLCHIYKLTVTDPIF